MILVSCGTEKYPFNRLATMVQELALHHPERKFIYQSRVLEIIPRGKNIDVQQLLPYREFRSLIQQCHRYICHAGIGSIVTALAEGIMPLVIPRRHDLGEHVDDHQLQITRKMADLNMIRVFHSMTELEALITDEKQQKVHYLFQNRPLLADLETTVNRWLK